MRKWGEQLMMADKIPTFYKRFIDDSFGKCTGNVKELEELAACDRHDPDGLTGP